MSNTRTAILSATDYYPFGMAISSRSKSLDASKPYTFGFGGQQISDEINANSYTAQFWQYDARIGRRLNLDPIDQFSISNYAAFRNSPIAFADPNGDNAIRDLYNTIAHNILRGFQKVGHSMGLADKPPTAIEEVGCVGKRRYSDSFATKIARKFVPYPTPDRFHQESAADTWVDKKMLYPGAKIYADLNPAVGLT